ncbi:kap113, partial [Symbiodinium necroappetens]
EELSLQLTVDLEGNGMPVTEVKLCMDGQTPLDSFLPSESDWEEFRSWFEPEVNRAIHLDSYTPDSTAIPLVLPFLGDWHRLNAGKLQIACVEMDQHSSRFILEASQLTTYNMHRPRLHEQGAPAPMTQRIVNFPGSTRILDFCESMIEWLAIYVSIEFVKIFKAEFANLERLSGSSKVLSAEEKNAEPTAIKEHLLRLVKAATDGGLPHIQELTMVLRRVCRFEFPMNWDGLAHLLLAELQGLRERGFSEAALAVVLVLHQVLKEQSSKRLLSSRREFHQLGGLLVEPLGAVWALKMEHMRHLKSQGSELVDDRLWRLSRHLDGSFLLLLAGPLDLALAGLRKAHAMETPWKLP